MDQGRTVMQSTTPGSDQCYGNGKMSNSTVFPKIQPCQFCLQDIFLYLYTT